MKEEIHKWLNSEAPDYEAGVSLFTQASKNMSLAHFLMRKGKSDATMARLTSELKRIANITEKNEPEKGNKNSTERTYIDKSNRINYEDLPNDIKELVDKNREDYKIMRGAHAEMTAAKTDEERAKFRAQIAELDDTITERWQKVDAYVAKGNEENATKAEQKSEIETLSVKEVNAYRTYISRSIKDGAKKLTPEKKETLQARVKALVKSNNALDDETLKSLEKLGIATDFFKKD